MSVAKCQKTTKVSKIKVQENNKSVTFLNPSKETYLVTQHDGCMVKNKIACDWVISKHDIGDVFIELKGRDIDHATVQVLTSVEYWKSNNLICGAVAGIIVGSQYPGIDTKIQRAMLMFAKKYKGYLRVYTHNIECTFSSII